MVLIVHKCSTNKAIEEKLKSHLIGCMDLRFNLAIPIVLHIERIFLSKINMLMVKLRGMLIEANIKEFTHQTAKKKR